MSGTLAARALSIVLTHVLGVVKSVARKVSLDDEPSFIFGSFSQAPDTLRRARLLDLPIDDPDEETAIKEVDAVVRERYPKPAHNRM